MRNPVNAIKTAVYSKLNGNISFSGGNVPVYSKVPKGTTGYYIILGQHTAIPDNCKGAFGNEVTLLIDIITEFLDGKGSDKPVNDIADSIMNALITNDRTQIIDLSPTHNCVAVQLDSFNTLEELIDSKYIIRGLLRLRIITHEV